MRYFILVFVVGLFFLGCSRQITNGLTVATPRANFLSGTKINLIVFDVRTEKRETVQLDRVFHEYLTKTFPRAWFRQFARDDYFREPNTGAVTLKIKIQEYDASARPLIRQDVYNTQGNISPPPVYATTANTGTSAVMDLIVTMTDRRNGFREYPIEIVETFPVGTRADGGVANDGMQIVLQKALDRVANFMDATLSY